MMRSLVWPAALAALAMAGTVAPAAAAPTPPLDHDGRWITDADGRAVILHGFNMVYKRGSYRPEDTGFGRDDARFLQRYGFNTVRLGIIYKGLEPQPPAADGTPRYRHGYHRPHGEHPCRPRNLQPARLPPGHVQRALPGRGVAQLADA